MRDGISRRQWLLGLLTGIGGAWLRQLGPAAIGKATAPPPCPAAASPALASCDTWPRAITCTYDCSGSLVHLAGQVTTIAYDAGRSALRPPEAGRSG
jgi:hypothetical protein